MSFPRQIIIEWFSTITAKIHTTGIVHMKIFQIVARNIPQRHLWKSNFYFLTINKKFLFSFHNSTIVFINLVFSLVSCCLVVMLHECVQICQRKRKSRLYQLLIFFCFLASILFFVHIPIGESSISRRIRQSSKAAARLFHHLIDSKTPHLGNFQLYIDSKRTIHNGLALRELFERWCIWLIKY